MDKEYLFIVEGPDDEDFFRQVVEPYCERQYPRMRGHIIVKPSSSWTAQDFRRQFGMYDEVIVVIDLDPSENGCPAVKKDRFCSIYGLHHEKNSICVVVAEIESWYIAVGSQNAPWLPSRFHSPKSTEPIVKEDLRREAQRNRKHLSVVMQAMLDSSDLSRGVARNESLRYFMAKLNNIAK